MTPEQQAEWHIAEGQKLLDAMIQKATPESLAASLASIPASPQKTLEGKFQDVAPTRAEREASAAEFDRLADAAANPTIVVFATPTSPARTIKLPRTSATKALVESCQQLASHYRAPNRRVAPRFARPRAAARTRRPSRRRPSGTRGSPVASPGSSQDDEPAPPRRWLKALAYVFVGLQLVSLAVLAVAR